MFSAGGPHAEDAGVLGEVCPGETGRDFGGLHRFLNDPYPSGPNPYFQRIEANLERLRQRMPPAT